MNLTIFMALYMVGLLVFIASNFLWQGLIMKNFYQMRLRHLLGEVDWVSVFAFCLVFVLGLTFFASYPAATKGTLATAVVLGSLYGFFTYSTYNLMNRSTLRDWSFWVTVVDIGWGVLSAALVSSLAFILHNFII